MRLPIITAALLTLAVPGMAQSLTVTDPHPAAANALHRDAGAARSDAQMNRAEARRAGRINTNQARGDAAAAATDNARAATQASPHVSIVP